MKKLGKLSLKEMEQEMYVISANELRESTGGYGNDCFWRCVSYIEGGGGTELDAESWANQYYDGVISCPGISASDYYNTSPSGAEMFNSDIANYASYRAANGTYSFSGSGQIRMFNTADNVGNYANTGLRHAIVITCVNSDGSADYYDAQLGIYGTFSASDMGKTQYAMY